MGTNDYRLMRMVDEKTRLAGSNKMELLLFSVSGTETLGINVFKVREVCEMMAVTPAPNLPEGVAGLISLRGSVIPVIDLAVCIGMAPGTGAGKLIITEFSGHIQAFRVDEVDRIVRVDWENVRAPQAVLMKAADLVNAITELPNGRIVAILDVEQILSNVMGDEALPEMEAVAEAARAMVFFADDSALARKRILDVLERLHLPNQQAQNGREALERLMQLAERAERDGVPLKSLVGLILVDAEMPEMDGYVLTRHVKSDHRFDGIPVLMHSSLSSVANQKLGQQVGVDAYVPKFKPEELAHTIHHMLSNAGPAPARSHP